MKTVKALVLLASLTTTAKLHAADPVWEWAQIAGGSGNDNGFGVAVSPSGEMFWSGCVSGGGKVGSVTAPLNPSHYWAKVTPAGLVSQVRLAPMSAGPFDNAIAVDSSAFVYSVGTYNGPITIGSTTWDGTGTFIVCLDSSLNTRWVKKGIDRPALSIPSAAPSINPQGHIAVTTAFSTASVDGITLGATGGSGQDALMLKLEGGSGSLSWMKRGGGINEDSGRAVCFDGFGNVYVGGYSESTTIAFGPVTVSTSAVPVGFVAKLDSGGTAQWVKTYPSSGARAQILALKAAANGDLIVGGGISDIVSVPIPSGPAAKAIFNRLTPDGQPVWTKSIANVVVRDIALATDGTIIISAGFIGTITIDSKSFTSRGDSDVFVGRFDANGNLIWGKVGGGAFQDYAGQVAMAPDGSIYFAGTLRDGGSFDSIYVEGRGSGDAFIAKLSPAIARSPRFTTQPQSTVASGGMSIELTAAAVGDAPLTYQWWFNGAPLTSQTSPSLVLANVRPDNAGSYFVVAKNSEAETQSEIANVSYTDAGALQLSVHPSLTIFGTVGRTYRIDYTVETRLPAVWTTVTNISLPTSPYVWQDTNAAITDKRFYRMLLQP